MKGNYEEKIEGAIKALEAGRIPHVRQAACVFEVAETTLRNRYSKKRGKRQQGHEGQQHLSVEKEKAVVRWIERVDDMGFPVRKGTT